MKKYLIQILLIILLCTTSVHSQEFFTDIIVTSPNGLWTDSRAYTTLNDAVTKIGSEERTLVIASEQVVTNLTIPSNITLQFERDGSINNTGTLIINTKKIIAPDRSIFKGSGDITFTNGTILRSSWFPNLVTALNKTNGYYDYLTLEITEEYTITEDVAVGDKTVLKWSSPRNRITVNAGFTLSNVRYIEAGEYQIFAGDGDIDFLDGTILNLSWFKHLRAVTTWVESEEVTLEITKSSTLDYNNTIPSNISVKINKGAILDGIVTLTINGPLEAGPYKIFGSALTVTGMTEVRSAWFDQKMSAAFSSGRLLKINSGTFPVDAPIGGGSANTWAISGVSSELTKLQQSGTKILDFSNYSYITNKTFFGEIDKISLIGDGVTGEPLIAIGGSDFLIFDRMVLRNGIANAIRVFSNLFSGIRIRDSWFFGNQPWSIYADAISLHDFQVIGNRFEGQGAAYAGSFNGLFLSGSPKNHTTPSANSITPIHINKNHFERLSCYAIYIDGSSGGVNIIDNNISWGMVFLSHKTSGATVKNNVFYDLNSRVVDSGFGNDASDNSYSDEYANGVLSSDHGYNSIIPDADNVNIGGSGSWTMPAGVNRIFGYNPAVGKLGKGNSISVSSNATLTQNITSGILPSTFYTIRAAWQVPFSTIKKTQGATVQIKAGAAELLNTGTVVDPASTSGLTSYDSWVFKTLAGTSNIDFNIIGANNETTYWHLIDLAKNVCQENPSFEDSWVNGFPNANWTKENDCTVTEYSLDKHSGSKCMRVQFPAIVTNTSRVFVNLGTSLVHGQSYEMEFWYKDISGGTGIVPIIAGPRNIAAVANGPGAYLVYSPVAANGDWEKVVMQFTHQSAHADTITLARLSANTYVASSDFLIDDFSIIPINVEFPEYENILATSGGVPASVAKKTTYVSTNGDGDLDNVTLANGLRVGQKKYISCISQGSPSDTWKVTPATLLGGTQITFGGVGEGCILEWTKNGWAVIGNSGKVQEVAVLANAATPSVSGCNIWRTGGTTTITGFTNGVVGQIITVIAEHSVTISDGSNILLSGSTNWAMTSSDTLTLVRKATGFWHEVARGDNGI